MNLEIKKIMVVCSEFNDELEAKLGGNGWTVIWVYDGATAIAKARREDFDLAVLVSTGKEMDVAETYLNLRDIRAALAIVVMTEHADEDSPATKPSFSLPNAKVMSAEGLDQFLESFKNASEKSFSTGSTNI